MFDHSEIKEGNQAIPAALRVEGCKLIGLKREETDKSLIISFARGEKNEEKLDLREFFPKRMPDQTDERFKTMVSMSVSRVAHIAKAFCKTEEEFLALTANLSLVDPDSASTAGDNWLVYTNAIGKFLKQKLGDDTVSKECALKVVLRQSKGKHYSSLPAVAPFISTVLCPQTFTENPQYDIFVKPKVSYTPDLEADSSQTFGDGSLDGAPTTPSVEDDFDL